MYSCECVHVSVHVCVCVYAGAHRCSCECRELEENPGSTLFETGSLFCCSPPDTPGQVCHELQESCLQLKSTGVAGICNHTKLYMILSNGNQILIANTQPLYLLNHRSNPLLSVTLSLSH